MYKSQALVRRFMEVFRQEVPVTPTIPSPEIMQARIRFLASEVCELADACGMRLNIQGEIDEGTDSHIKLEKIPGREPDLLRIYDAMLDIQVFNDGTAVAAGLDLEPGFEAVNENNMSKWWELDELGQCKYDWKFYPHPDLPGKYVVHDAGGKIKKPPRYVPVDLAPILAAQMPAPVAPAA